MSQETMNAVLGQGGSYLLKIKTLPKTSTETVNLPLTPELQTGIADAATVALTVSQPISIAEIDSLGQNTTVNLTIASNMQKGALLYIKMTCGATPYNIILGTGTDAKTILGIASTVKWITLVYNGTAYQTVNEKVVGESAGTYETQALTATGAQAVTITKSYTIIDGVTTAATGNRTLNLTVTGAPQGALILVKTKSSGTETLIFGTNVTAPTITGVAGKTQTQAFWFDGTGFYPTGTFVQVD